MVLIDQTFTPSAIGAALPRPPVFAIRVSIQRAIAGDREVFLVIGIDAGRIIHALHAFPTAVDQRQISRSFLRELERGPGGNVQVHVAL